MIFNTFSVTTYADKYDSKIRLDFEIFFEDSDEVRVEVTYPKAKKRLHKYDFVAKNYDEFRQKAIRVFKDFFVPHPRLITHAVVKRGIPQGQLNPLVWKKGKEKLKHAQKILEAYNKIGGASLLAKGKTVTLGKNLWMERVETELGRIDENNLQESIKPFWVWEQYRSLPQEIRTIYNDLLNQSRAGVSFSRTELLKYLRKKFGLTESKALPIIDVLEEKGWLVYEKRQYRVLNFPIPPKITREEIRKMLERRRRRALLKGRLSALRGVP